MLQQVTTSINELINSNIKDPYIIKPAKKIKTQNDFSKDELNELLKKINSRLRIVEGMNSIGRDMNIQPSHLDDDKIKDKLDMLNKVKNRIENYLRE